MLQLTLWCDTRIDRLASTFAGKYRFAKFDWGLDIAGFDRETSVYDDLPGSMADEWLWRYTCASLLCAHETLKNTIKAMSALFERWPHWTDLATAPEAEVRATLSASGVARDEQKGPWLIANAQTVTALGSPPKTTADLMSLKGIGEHCAEIIRAYVFGDNTFAVDTHVSRITTRLGVSVQAIRGRTDLDLPGLSSGFVEFGKTICSHHAPACNHCPVADMCGRTPQESYQWECSRSTRKG